MASSPWVSYMLMALSTKNLVYSAGTDLGGMEATTPRAIRSASAAVIPASGWGMSANVRRIASSTSAEVIRGSGTGASAISERTISSTSARDSPASPSPQATRRRESSMASAANDNGILVMFMSVGSLLHHVSSHGFTWRSVEA